MRFSEREGYKPVRAVIQVESADHDLRNSLWNAIDEFMLERMHDWPSCQEIIRNIWGNLYKLRFDEQPREPFQFADFLQKKLFNGPWYEVYDFIEFVIQHYKLPPMRDEAGTQAVTFTEACNYILERECSAWRIVGDRVTRITSEEEIAAVEAAESLSGEYAPVSRHIQQAVALLSIRQRPGYRNAMKEAISSVEAMCQIVTGDEKAELGQALKKLGTSGILIHGAARDAFSKLYGYTSDAEGIRHALIEPRTVDFDDAKFMLVACSAFVNLLKARADQAHTIASRHLASAAAYPVNCDA